MINCTRSADLVDTNNLYLGRMFRGQCLVNISASRSTLNLERTFWRIFFWERYYP